MIAMLRAPKNVSEKKKFMNANIERRKYNVLDGLPGFARIPKRKINQELKKNMLPV